MGKIIGIDLGTTNSCVAVMEGGQPTVIEMCIRDRRQVGSVEIPQKAFMSVLKLDDK